MHLLVFLCHNNRKITTQKLFYKELVKISQSNSFITFEKFFYNAAKLYTNYLKIRNNNAEVSTSVPQS